MTAHRQAVRGASQRRAKGSRERQPRRSAPGFDARQLAVRSIGGVIEQRRTFDAAWEAAIAANQGNTLEARDRAFARLIVGTVLRRHGELAAVVSSFLAKPLPERRGLLWPILLSAAAQLLILNTPPHAAISMAVDQARADPLSRHFTGLVNAILRRVATEGPAILATLDAPAVNIPHWMMERWRDYFGSDLANAIAAACMREAPLDISVKENAPEWAATLSGQLLPTGSIRVAGEGRIEDMPGYDGGSWWVQDASAALPARLFGNVEGLRIADVCAAPGGKACQLLAAGAKVTCVEQSAARAQRLETNLKRLALNATIVVADAVTWKPEEPFDAVLLDAPCTATGTIRRHPDILHLKREADIAQLAAVQTRLLDAAAGFVKPGGQLVYCSCSLQPEEGEAQIAAFLNRTPAFERQKIEPNECGILPEWLTQEGELRTHLQHLTLDSTDLSGMDGFFASRMRRRA